ncbi:MAG: hypothetical protein AB8B69_01885 [Chitinophagales bacterium]
MKKTLLFLSFLMASSFWANAQHATVIYNYERNTFNENQPLPAEKNFMLNGGITTEINMIELTIYRAGDEKQKHPLFHTHWKRPFNNQQDVFSMPVNYKLKGNDEYDFAMTYFRNLSDAEREYVRLKMFQTMDSYIQSNLTVNRKSITMLKPKQHMLKDLNSIMYQGLKLYRSRTSLEFEGFSDIVKDKLEQVERADLNKGKFIFFGKEKTQSRAEYAGQLVADLMKLLHNEVEQYLNASLMTVYDTRLIDDYPVERTNSSISLNVGYGGVYFDGDLNELNYGQGLFIGASIPFARRAFSPFWANTSISFGVFLDNLENAEGLEVTGPIVKRPVYVGLGHKIFKFIRINAGVALTEEETSTGIGDIGLKDINLKPFVGISAEINLSLGFGDK